MNRVPGKLRQFVLDLHSGKLHREFHHGPDPTDSTPGQVRVHHSCRMGVLLNKDLCWACHHLFFLFEAFFSFYQEWASNLDVRVVIDHGNEINVCLFFSKTFTTNPNSFI